MNGEEVIDYIRCGLAEKYDEETAGRVITRLRALLAEATKTDDTRDEFRSIMETAGYPFLLCLKAMKEEGLDEQEAAQFTKEIWSGFAEDRLGH